MKISKTLVAAAVTAISGVACAASLPNVAVLATGGTIAGAARPPRVRPTRPARSR